MITFIAAIDSNRGLANDHGIPWLGKIPTDIAHFRDQTKNHVVVMGYKTYTEFEYPLSKRRNIVATHKDEALRSGFEAIADIRTFLQQTNEDIWVIGGAALFASTLDLADILDLTLLQGDFGCTKFFPNYTQDFVCTTKDAPIAENGITFRFTTWKRKV